MPHPFKSGSLAFFTWCAIGGLSFVLWPALLLVPPPPMILLPLLVLIFSLPHFTLSYFLFYSRPELRARHRFEAWVAPIVLAAVLVATMNSPTLQPHLLQAAWLFFFYHLAKQTAGVTLFYSPKAHPHYKTWKRLVTATSLSLAALAWVLAQRSSSPLIVFKGAFPALPFVGAAAPYLMGLVGLLGALMIAFAWRYRFTGSALGVLAEQTMLWTPLLALTTWSVPVLGLTAYIPILHGLQYMPFAQKRLRLDRWSLQSLIGIMIVMAVIAYGAFEFIPQKIALQGLQYTNVITAVYVFLNVHHYVIDRVLWTKRSFYDRMQAPSHSERAVSEKSAA